MCHSVIWECRFPPFVPRIINSIGGSTALRSFLQNAENVKNLKYRSDKVERNMTELTILLFIMAIGLYVMLLYSKRIEMVWLTFFMSVCSFGQTLSDTTLESMEVTILIVPMFYVLLMSGLYVMRGKVS